MSQWDQRYGETPIDTSGLIPKHIATRSDLDQAEALNIAKAIRKYLASRPTRRVASFTLAWIYRLHSEMFGDVWQWAGQRRNRELNIGIPYYNVDVGLQNLLDDLQSWRANNMPLLEQSVLLHYRAVHIHPFLNGNGRWARLLANIYLRREGHRIVEWPDSVIGQESTIRAQYIQAIKTADQGNLTPLIELHREYTPHSIP